MKEQTMAEHYDDLFERKNKIDETDDGLCLVGHLVCALSGGIVGFVGGYLFNMWIHYG